jgi:hypothetical protein
MNGDPTVDQVHPEKEPVSKLPLTTSSMGTA